MQCRQCGKDLADSEYKMVAEWPFCQDCFQHLLDTPPKETNFETETDESLDGAGFEAPDEPVKRRCQLCKREIVGDHYKKVGIWLFCPQCHLDMTPRSKPPAPRQAQEAPSETEKTDDRDAGVRVTFQQRVKCVGCSRMIPEGGSRDVEGRPYCPECYYAQPEEVRAAAEAVESELPQTAADTGCQSCGQKAAKSSLRTVEGFAICAACLASDAQLAVSLARGRHRKHLQRLRDELEPTT